MLGWSEKASWRRWREDPQRNDRACKKGITERVTWTEVRVSLGLWIEAKEEVEDAVP